jgi:hypothetical protein
MDHDHVPTYDCSECDKTFASEQGLKAHMTRSHQPKGTAGDLTSDEAFNRIAKATEALFPEGIPAVRVMLIADLQRQMLKVVTAK